MGCVEDLIFDFEPCAEFGLGEIAGDGNLVFFANGEGFVRY